MGYARAAFLSVALIALPLVASAQTLSTQNPAPPAQIAPLAQTPIAWQYGAFIDVGRLFSSTSPSNHLFRNRGTTPRVDKWDLNMTLDHVIGLLVTAALLVYLTYALLRPEKF